MNYLRNVCNSKQSDDTNQHTDAESSEVLLNPVEWMQKHPNCRLSWSRNDEHPTLVVSGQLYGCTLNYSKHNDGATTRITEYGPTPEEAYFKALRVYLRQQ